MGFIIRNIRLCFSLLLLSFAVFFVTCNKPFVTVKKIAGEPTANKNAQIDTIIHNDTNQVALYLSFDDGPTRGSSNLNAIALADSININVFVIGKFVFKSDSNRRLFQQYQQNPFIEIGNHSYAHANGHYHLFYKNADEVKKEFLMNYDTLGLHYRTARLPGRNCWQINGRSKYDLEDAKAASDSLAVYGYKIYGWDTEWRYDSTGRIIETADEMYEKIKHISDKKNSFTRGNIVILCHDPMLADSYNESEFKLFIQKIKKDGNYRFEHLSNYARSTGR
jgi:peptidoglycan/xylan/chitin deacetylase (PgdA/CDA1 family)